MPINGKANLLSDHVYWVLELAVKRDEVGGFKDLMNEMVNATLAEEPGTLNYEWTSGADGVTCHIYERYVDSAAVMTYLESFGANFEKRFFAAVERMRFAVYGDPSADVSEALDDGFPTAYMTPAAGFAR